MRNSAPPPGTQAPVASRAAGQSVPFFAKAGPERRWFGVLLVLLAIAALAMSKMRPFWFDELFTILVARQPTLHQFALAMPPDANPPLFAFLVRLLTSILGTSEVVVRLPSVVAFLGSMVGVWVFVRRRCGGMVALLAVAVLMSQPGWAYAYEARPYSLLLFFMMLVLVSWQSAASRSSQRLLPLLGMVVGIAGAMASHHIGLVEVGLPVFCGELVRLRQRHRSDWPVAATFLVAVPMLLWTLPMAHRTRMELLVHAPANQHVHLTLHVLMNDWIKNALLSLFLIIDMASIFLLVGLIGFGWKWLRRQHNAEDVPKYEVAAAAGAFLLIPVTLVLMMLTTGYYNCRYGIGSIAGLALLAGFGCSKVLGGRRDLLAGLTFAFAGFFLVSAVPTLRATRNSRIYPEAELGDSNLPVIFTDPFKFYPIWWYATPAQRSRMLYLTNEDAAKKNGIVVADLAFQLEASHQPVQIESYDDFLKRHSHFLAYFPEGMDKDELSQRLRASGYALDTAGDSTGHLFDARLSR